MLPLLQYLKNGSGMPGSLASTTDTSIKAIAMATSKDLLRTVTKHGFTLVRSRKHLIFDHPCGARLVTASSASDVRSIRNVEANIKRILKGYGIEV